jgi:hypothetical protein
MPAPTLAPYPEASAVEDGRLRVGGCDASRWRASSARRPTSSRRRTCGRARAFTPRWRAPRRRPARCCSPPRRSLHGRAARVRRGGPGLRRGVRRGLHLALRAGFDPERITCTATRSRGGAAMARRTPGSARSCSTTRRTIASSAAALGAARAGACCCACAPASTRTRTRHPHGHAESKFGSTPRRACAGSRRRVTWTCRGSTSTRLPAVRPRALPRGVAASPRLPDCRSIARRRLAVPYSATTAPPGVPRLVAAC